MIAAGLRPTDPIRWYMALSVERALAEQERDQQQATGHGVGDIEVIDDGA